MRHLNPIEDMNHAITNASKSDAKAITKAIKLYHPDKYMDSKRDCHKIVNEGLKALDKDGHNTRPH